MGKKKRKWRLALVVAGLLIGCLGGVIVYVIKISYTPSVRLLKATRIGDEMILVEYEVTYLKDKLAFGTDTSVDLEVYSEDGVSLGTFDLMVSTINKRIHRGSLTNEVSLQGVSQITSGTLFFADTLMNSQHELRSQLRAVRGRVSATGNVYAEVAHDTLTNEVTNDLKARLGSAIKKATGTYPNALKVANTREVRIRSKPVKVR